jgi:hypothetical protein
MALLGRIVVIFFAFLLAAVAAAVVFTLSIFVTMWNSGSSWSSVSMATTAFFQTGGSVFILLTIFAFLPSMIVAAIAEIYRIRSVLFYILSAGMVAIFSTAGFRFVLSLVMFQPKVEPQIGTFSANWTLVVSGMVAGLVYWAVAGRQAGVWRQGRT